jgi:hypothetical protein
MKRKRPSIFGKILESFEYLQAYFYRFTHPNLKERVEHLEITEKILNNQKN